MFVILFQGEVQALFLRHEGYLGTIGAFLKGAEEDSKLFRHLTLTLNLLDLRCVSVFSVDEVYCICPDPNQYSWEENYAGSSGLMSVSPDLNPMQRARSGTVSRPSYDQCDSMLSFSSFIRYL